VIAGIIQYKDLLYMLTLRDLRVRYKQAFMGFLWAIFMPMIAILAGILFKKVVSIASGLSMNLIDVVSITVKVLPWTFFISALKFSVNSLVSNNSLITKIYFPREILVYSSILACLFDFLIGSITLAVLLLFAHTGMSAHIIFLPLILISLIFFTTGLGLIFSSANLFFRDVKYIVEVILMFGIFFTPVFFDSNTFGKWKTLILINPMGGLLEGINSVVVLHKIPDIFWLLYSIICSIIVFVVGLSIFRKTEFLFSENI